MFRFDLSLLSTRSCRTADKVPYKAIEGNSVNSNSLGPRQRKKNPASSPARTARTQTTSSTCSANNNISLSSIEQELFHSRNPAVEAWATEFSPPPKQDGFRSTKLSPPSSLSMIRKAPSYESFEKKSTFSGKGRSASLTGRKSVLTNLRKHISLLNTMSSDSGTSSKISTMKAKIRRNRSKSLPVIPREVSLNIAEGGEGVEITTSEHKNRRNMLSGSIFDIKIPKIRRETSTHATPSLTSGEQSTEIYQEDDEIRKLCNLMKKIRKDDDMNMGFESEHSSSSNSFGDSLTRSDKELEMNEEPCQGPDIFDLMVFVNNEHKVLEYAPDEFNEFESK